MFDQVIDMIVDIFEKPALSLSLGISAQIECDLEHPCGEFRIAAKFSDISDYPEPRFLKQILSLGFLARKAPRETVQPIEVRPYKFLECNVVGCGHRALQSSDQPARCKCAIRISNGLS